MSSLKENISNKIDHAFDKILIKFKQHTINVLFPEGITKLPTPTHLLINRTTQPEYIHNTTSTSESCSLPTPYHPHHYTNDLEDNIKQDVLPYQTHTDLSEYLQHPCDHMTIHMTQPHTSYAQNLSNQTPVFNNFPKQDIVTIQCA